MSDVEVRGASRFLAWVPSHGETDADAIEIDAYGIASAAERAAERMWYHHDGWEWMSKGTTLRLRGPDGAVLDWEISVEAEPRFYAYSLGPAEQNAPESQKGKEE